MQAIIDDAPVAENAFPLPKQARSRARRAAMIETGVKLLNQRDFDDISIAEITSQNGYSTGSFYSAFEDKASFFVQVHNAVAGRVREKAELELQKARELGSGEELIHWLVDFMVEVFRSHRGLLKTSLRHESDLPDAWAPYHRTGQIIAGSFADALRPHLGVAAVTRTRFLVQAIYGVLVNAILHDPGPLRLDDNAIGVELKQLAQSYLNLNNSPET